MLVTLVAVDILLVANLLYFRTYGSAIPLYSYGLASNLTDFRESVYASFRWADTLFFLSTVAAGWYMLRIRRHGDASCTGGGTVSLRYLILPGSLLVLCGGLLIPKGGFGNAYRSLQSANKHSCDTPMYTVIGSILYDFMEERAEYTPEIGVYISQWISEHPVDRGLSGIQARENCIILLLESFESWVIGLEVEGKEITPNLNRLLSDTAVYFAPHVLSQVKGGRSIDAQLMVNTGLLPIRSGTYSTQYPGNEYPSLVKAFREKFPAARTSVLSIDKHIVWNQGLVARAFGYDRLLDRASFVQEDRIGPRKKTGDVPFLRQCAEKIVDGEVWDREGNNFVQIVTYSGHSPFRIPEELAYISLEGDMPGIMRDYMTMANYTDHAVGLFLDMLDKAGILDHTTVVITGDHEGLADNCPSLVDSPAGRGIVSPFRFTPLVILNSPVEGRYDPVMGQIDIYPTLLDLMGLDNYRWRGLGTSVYDPTHDGAACSPQMQIIGNTDGLTTRRQDRLREAWEISDLIICYDYFSRIE